MRRFPSGLQLKIKELVAEGLHLQTFQLYKDELHCLRAADVISILPSIIKSCSSVHHCHGLQLHCTALKSASISDAVVSNSLITMYAKLTLVGAARKVFDEMPETERDPITWNSIVNCYLQNGHQLEALDVLKDQIRFYGGFTTKPELIAGIVSVCSRTREYRIVGRQIHGLVVVNDMISNEDKYSVFLSTALVDLYMRCHDTLTAFHVFRNMQVKNEVSWTAMISGCVVNQCYGLAMNCFWEMQVVQGLRPNRVTVLALLPACAEMGDIRHGKEIHAYSFRHGFESDPHCSAALINMYCKCRKDIRPAKLIFDKEDCKDVVMWSSMIECYSQCGDSVKAMELFSRMRAGGIDPNSVTLLAIISTCTSLSSLQIGRGVHNYVLKCGFNSDIFIGNALINMYAKCGSFTDSHEIFKEMPSTDPVSWSTMIESYALHGRGNEALKLFLEMQDRGIEPDAVCFLSVLSACNHTGLLEEGRKVFEQMVKGSNVTLSLEHYACYINLLGKFGELEDACEIVRSMPMKPSSRIWSSLVTACRVHGRLEIAESLAHHLVRKEPLNAANHTLLSMVHAEAQNWSGVEEVRRVMRVHRLTKSYGFSRIS